MLKVVEPLVPKKQQNNEEMAKALEGIAGMLRTGEVDGFQIVFQYVDDHGGGYGYRTMGLDCEQTIALLRRVEHRLMLDWDKGIS